MKPKAKQNFTEGGLFFKILFFSLPIMATSVLQMLYSSADNIVVGRFSGDDLALAAVGCTAAYTNLIINLLIGVSSGAAVVCAQHFGAGRHGALSRAVHTAMTVSLIGGILFMGIGLLTHRPVLDLMISDEMIFEKACLYVLIICLGVPASSIYNFGAAILRSVGDSKTPLIILSSSGLLNVALNLVFVLGCGMSVSGVATATIISQYASAIAVVAVLMKRRGECYHFDPRKMTIDIASLKRMLAIGVPAGLQSSAYSISNLFIIKGVNTFDRPYISANTIAGNVDNILYVSMVAFTQAAMTAVGQNYGAGKRERINKTLIYTLAQALSVGLIVSTTIFLLKENLVALYVDSGDPLYGEVVVATVRWISFFIFPYMICGVFEVLSGFLRGLGNSTSTMIIVLTCCCLTRILWVSFVFPYLPHEIESLIWCYPISWSLSVISACGVLIYEMRRLGKALKAAHAKQGEGTSPHTKAV